MYLELHTSSSFSFLDGASLPATLVERAAELGYPAVALLDRDGLYGAPQFYRAAKQAGLKAIVGAELTIGSDPDLAKRPAGTPTPWALPVLVQSAEGYRNLCRIITRAGTGRRNRRRNIGTSAHRPSGHRAIGPSAGADPMSR